MKFELVEMPESLSESEACDNINRVPRRQWRKWNQQSRFIFNQVYNRMAYQETIKHPIMSLVRPELWDTIRWNAAWLAADAAYDSLKPVQHPVPLTEREQ